MLTTVQDTVRTLIIPMRGRNLLLPNVAVAEVVPYMRPRAIDAAPEWMLGVISWRGLTIPLISYDTLYGAQNQDGIGQARIAVLNTVRQDSGLPFYAVVTTGIPQLKRVHADLLQEQPGERVAGVLSQVLVGDVQTVIPDLEELESAVAKYWAAAGVRH